MLLGLGIGKRSGELSVHLSLAKPRDEEDLKERYRDHRGDAGEGSGDTASED